MADSPEDHQPALFLKYFSLVALTLQNTVLILVMRYVRTRPGDMFLASAAVICQEFLKMVTSLALVLYQEKSIKSWLKYLYDNTIDQPMDCVKVSVPSVIYVLQNNLLYVAVSNLDAATYQVTYQLKILTTAIFSVIMLKKVLSIPQWAALGVLFVGVSVVQLQPSSKVEENVAVEQRPFIGLFAVIVSCFLSGFAGVYFEKILKGTRQSIWLRNFQLGFLGIIIGVITMLFKDSTQFQEKGFFHGFDFLVWVVIGLQSFGGLMVAMVVKYADNILKGFATSAAIVLSSVASIFIFNFVLSPQFTIGAGLVMLALYVYGTYAPQPLPEKPIH
ncbi:UDP-galactose translocator-like isoform X2 [Liolophura sinensis]|uniref:UDP-galactose translocator-like isoform X2 n=1 Tax=Liolophura sinensis TaxID=3198878 RepID=UPI003159856B